MKLHRFYIKNILENKGEIRIESINIFNQIKKVLRLNKGERLILFDNSGFDYIVILDRFNTDSVYVSLLEKKENLVCAKDEIYLFASIVKKDKYEWVVEKATELGVSHIVPIVSNRSEKKNLNIERLIRISIEASEQSGRGMLPIIHDVMNLKEALERYSHLKSIAWDSSFKKFTKEDLYNILGTYIGPEGGWSKEEIEMFQKNNIPVHSLGQQTLKTETATVVAISRLWF